MMNNLRNSRLRARRSRKANIPALRRVSLADFSRRRRPPTNPFAAWNNRFLALFRAAPLLERIDQLFLWVPHQHRRDQRLGTPEIHIWVALRMKAGVRRR